MRDTIRAILSENPSDNLKKEIKASGLTPLQYALHLFIDAQIKHDRGWAEFDGEYGDLLKLEDFYQRPEKPFHEGLSAIKLMKKNSSKIIELVGIWGKMRRLEMSLKKTYYMDTKRIFCIWFSDKPGQWTTAANIHRLIRHAENNPSVKLTFIYRAACLSAETHQSLIQFAAKFNLHLVEFDKDLPAMLQTDDDKILYERAKEEIQLAIEKQGGNLAGASDCIRLMRAVNEKLGFYKEIDLDHTLEKAPEMIVLKTPVVFPVVMFEKKPIPQSSNNVLAFAYDSPDCTQLHPDALTLLSRIQKIVISNYANPLAIAEKIFNDFATAAQQTMEFKAKGTLKSIFEFRKSLAAELAKPLGDSMNLTLSEYFTRSVTLVSGPGAICAAFEQLAAQEFLRLGLDYNQLASYIDYRHRWGNSDGLSWAPAGNAYEKSLSEKLSKAIALIERKRMITLNLGMLQRSLTPQLKALKVRVPHQQKATSATVAAPAVVTTKIIETTDKANPASKPKQTGFCLKFPKGGGLY